MTPRGHLAAVLADALPAGVPVIAYARDGIQPDRSTVLVRLDSVEPGPAQGVRRYRFALILISPLLDEHGSADDELDALLEDVLHALETADTITGWQDAQRATYSDAAMPAYSIALHVHFTTDNN